MSLPTSVIIFGLRYKVVLCKRKLPKDLSGDIDYEKRIIRIDANDTIEGQMQTLIHEMLHAYIKRISINQVIDSQVEEILVDTIPTMLTENFILKPK